MKQQTAKALLTIGILLLHALTAWRTGVDTYSVTGDLLNVVLIDATFVIAALAAAYLGSSVESLFIRPVAAVLAWVLYIQMVVIGLEAHTTHPEVALAVRSAGFGLLVLDTWVYIVAAGRRIRSGSVQAKDWRANLRSGVASIAYVLASILLAPMVALIMLAKSLADYVRDARGERKQPMLARTGITVRGVQAVNQAIARELDRTITNGFVPSSHASPQPAEYAQADDGTWSFICPVCGPQHEGARIKPYPDEKAARRGYAAHSATHNRQSQPPAAPVLVGNDQ